MIMGGFCVAQQHSAFFCIQIVYCLWTKNGFTYGVIVFNLPTTEIMSFPHCVLPVSTAMIQ